MTELERLQKYLNQRIEDLRGGNAKGSHSDKWVRITELERVLTKTKRIQDQYED